MTRSNPEHHAGSGPSRVRRRTARAAALGLLCLSASLARADNTPWHIETAPVRYRVDLVQPPTLDAAGYFVTLPDGGLIPSTTPASRVVDPAGNELQSYCLHTTRKYGFVVLFAPPRSGRSVTVYLENAPRVNVYTPDSGLTPSLLLYVKSGRASVASARQLKAGRDRDDTQLLRFEPGGDNPLQLWCEQTRQNMYGLGGAYSARLSGYLRTTDPGRTWVSAFSMFRTRAEPTQQGMEVYIDDTQIEARTRLSDKSCGEGQWIDLSAGLHKLDIFHAAAPDERFGSLVLTWRTPNTSIEELGGRRAPDLPYPGTPMWEARPLRMEEIVQSGKGVVRAVEEKQGAPLACFTARPRKVFWRDEEKAALILYEFEAMDAGNPPDVDYTWQPDAGAALTGLRMSWLYPAYREHTMQLTAATGTRKSVVSLPFFAFQRGLGSDLNDPATRQTFRDVFRNMLNAYPPEADPTAAWNDPMWDLFFSTLELGSSRLLLAEIFGRHWTRMRKHLDPTAQWKVEDFFYEWLSFKSPDKCIQWLQATEKNERNAQRRKELRLMQATVYMYGLGDLNKARSIASGLTAGRSDLSALATVRLGDMALLSGDLQKATRLYGEVQERAKTDEHLETGRTGLQWIAPPRWKQTAGAVPPGRRTPSGVQQRIDDWKQTAVLNTSAAETARTLLDQGYHEQVRNVLQRWERLIPLSKITSDYVLYDAELAMELGNYRRARTLLEAYCTHIELSSFIPAAAELLLTCLIQTDASPDEIRTFGERLKKQLPFHPVTDKLDTILDRIQRGASDRATLLDAL